MTVANILCQTKRWFAFSKIGFCAGTKCSQIFGLAQKIWTGKKHFGTCERTRLQGHLAWGCYSTVLGHFNICRYISVQCRNVLVPKRPYYCAWCRNILVLKHTHTVMSHAEKSPCQKVPVPKCPRVEKSMCRKIPEWKSPLAEMSMETKCLYAVTSTEPKSPFCQNVPMMKCPC